MKILKEEKGSITLFVLLAMLFFVMFLVGMYMLSANSESSQTAEIARIKEIYEQDVDNIDDVYATLTNFKTHDYISEGLVLYYDLGKKDSVQGNLLKDLSGNGNDGTINGATVQDGSLQLDGVDDWVAIKELNYSNITLEIVLQHDENPGNEESAYIENFQAGGYGLSSYDSKASTPYNKFSVFINNKYETCSSSEEILKGKVYSLSGSYDQNNIYFSENGVINTTAIQGNIGYSQNQTIMSLGCNPNGTESTYGFFKGKIYAVRIYNRALTKEEILNNYNIDQKRFKISNEIDNGQEYIKEGLILHYDGKNKYGVKCEDSTVWKDLSGNGNNGIIRGASIKKDSVEFDGNDDWVSIKELNYPNITIEAIIEYNQSPVNNEMSIASNFEGGGYALSNYSLIGSTPYNKFTAYVTDNYYSVVSANEIKTNHKYYLSGSYDGKNLKLSEDGYINTLQIEGTIQYPQSNTIMALGTNPSGYSSYGGFFNGKIYSIRIYNRALTEEEIKNNYNLDKIRFGE